MLEKITGFYGYYVSDTGDVYNANYWRSGDLHILKPQKQANGYLTVCLYKNKKGYIKSIHRLVAETFIPNPYNKPQVNHKNGIKTDNRVENLEWVCASENQRHRFDVLNKHNKKGKDNSCSKIVLQIKNDKIISVFYGTQEAQRKTGVKQQGISACCLGKRKTAGGFKWVYKQV